MTVATWFDAPTQIHALLVAKFPSWLIAPERDAKINKYPALIWSMGLSNPNDLGIWKANLTLTLFCSTDEAAAKVAAVFEEVKSWQTPGPINSVDLVSFNQARSDVSETVHQYVFIYSLTWDL